MPSTEDLSGVYNLTVPNSSGTLLVSISDYQIIGCKTDMEYVTRNGKIDFTFLGEGFFLCNDNVDVYRDAFKKSSSYKINQEGFNLHNDEGVLVMEAKLFRTLTPIPF